MSAVLLANECRTARTPHRCCECRIKILPGEKYWHYAGLFDGDFVTASTCAACQELRDAVTKDWAPSDWADGIEFGALDEFCHEDEALLPRWKAQLAAAAAAQRRRELEVKA
jgi:hypothetical protein